MMFLTSISEKLALQNVTLSKVMWMKHYMLTDWAKLSKKLV